MRIRPRFRNYYEEKFSSFGLKSLNARELLEELVVNGMIILKSIFKKDGSVWSGFM
jgi:hypothetical protein